MQQASVAGEFGASRSGDFEALVRVYRPRVFRFILASVRSRETAENLTQDCFIRAYKAREHFRGDSNVGTWLTSIAANVVRNHESSQRLKFWRRALRPAAEEEPAQIDWVPDRAIARMFATWPARIRADRAARLGLAPDPDFDSIIRMHLAESGGRG